MVRCCRSLHSPPSCYNLHRVRVDVRRFRTLGSPGPTGEPSSGASSGGGRMGESSSQLSQRNRFRCLELPEWARDGRDEVDSDLASDWPACACNEETRGAGECVSPQCEKKKIDRELCLRRLQSWSVDDSKPRLKERHWFFRQRGRGRRRYKGFEPLIVWPRWTQPDTAVTARNKPLAATA